VAASAAGLSVAEQVEISLKGLEAMVRDLVHETKVWPRMDDAEHAS
jgi:hypothetical protein